MYNTDWVYRDGAGPIVYHKSDDGTVSLVEYEDYWDFDKGIRKEVTVWRYAIVVWRTGVATVLVQWTSETQLPYELCQVPNPLFGCISAEQGVVSVPEHLRNKYKPQS